MSIEQADMLHGVSAADAARLVALGSRVHVPSGALLFELGAEATGVFLIERGRIALTLPMVFGDRHEDVMVEDRTAGQLVGWSGLIPPHRFTLKASAQIDTDVLALPRAAVLAQISHRGGVFCGADPWPINWGFPHQVCTPPLVGCFPNWCLDSSYGTFTDVYGRLAVFGKVR